MSHVHITEVHVVVNSHTSIVAHSYLTHISGHCWSEDYCAFVRQEADTVASCLLIASSAPHTVLLVEAKGLQACPLLPFGTVDYRSTGHPWGCF